MLSNSLIYRKAALVEFLWKVKNISYSIWAFVLVLLWLHLLDIGERGRGRFCRLCSATTDTWFSSSGDLTPLLVTFLGSWVGNMDLCPACEARAGIVAVLVVRGSSVKYQNIILSHTQPQNVNDEAIILLSKIQKWLYWCKMSIYAFWVIDKCKWVWWV